MKLDEEQKSIISLLVKIFAAVAIFIYLGTLFEEPQKQQAQETTKEEPLVELIRYQEDIEEFSLHYVNGTILNKSDKTLSVTVWADAYNGNDTYINSFMDYAPNLEPNTKWDFYISVPQSTRKVKLRDIETHIKN